MPETSDADLLTSWLDRQSEAGFRTLVDRYAGLVYMAAKRTCRDEVMAKEASQLTFITLARKAGPLSSRDSVAGWLHVTAMMQAKNLLQLQRRESLKRERLETHLESMSPDPSSTLWKNLEPVLDEALAALSKPDREAILLRHYRSLSVREVAASLAISVDAAQKRLDRALERLRRQLARRGYAVGSTLGAAMLTGLATDAKAGAPLASSFATKAMTAGPVAVVPAVTAFLLTLMTKKIAIGAVVVLLALGILALKEKYRSSSVRPVAAAVPPSGEPKAPAGAAREMSAAGRENARLVAKYGTDRTTRSRAVVGQAIEISTKVQAFLDQIFAVMGKQSSGGAEMMPQLSADFKLSDGQQKQLMALTLDLLKRKMTSKKEGLERIIENPALFVEMLLAGDACARGEMTLQDYEERRKAVGPDLVSMENPVDMESLSLEIGADFDYEDEAFINGLKTILEPSQVNAFVKSIKESIPNDAKAEMERQKVANFSALPPTDLGQLETKVAGTLKMMEGLAGQLQQEMSEDDEQEEAKPGK